MKAKYIQGDVALVPVEKTNGEIKKTGDVVLAEGETTGHRHVLRGAVQYVDANGQVSVQVDQPAQLVHEEHHELTIQPGAYRVVIQREFDLTQGVRQVMD